MSMANIIVVPGRRKASEPDLDIPNLVLRTIPECGMTYGRT
jgi:hypothetical protein